MELKKFGWYSAAISLTVLTLLLLVWFSLGVGIIGGDGDIANLLYAAVLVVTAVVAVRGRFQPQAMMWALISAALVQALIALLAVYTGLGLPHSGPAELILLNGFFVLLYLGAAMMFRRANKESA
ncbi:hypothetical protein [Rheinheimera sp. 4Y26]|uniref:hypothetical protein n=1 Tax=Rheinheimera sp. 4Y26 TaxID=2977811 RepID=UPI0021B1386B|nr:hypothetical protein [Rheinheimera sp. 4Y26]MCT6699804.1 hypothetical protein [Rheinheimera sp. 4Y26]